MNKETMRGVPDAIHHTDLEETLEYITGWNDCRQAMLAEQPAQQEPVAKDNSNYRLDPPWRLDPLYTTPQPAQHT